MQNLIIFQYCFLFAYLGEVERLNWEESVDDADDLAGDSDEGGHVNNETLDEHDNLEASRSECPETTTNLNKSDSGIETLGGKLLHVVV